MTFDFYRITIKEHLDREWSDWFDGLSITLVDNGETVLSLTKEATSFRSHR